jgi:hypothetical protein
MPPVAALISSAASAMASPKISRRSPGLLFFLLAVAVGPAISNQSQERQLLECRAQAAREARTEAGTKAMLADCSKRFPQVRPPAPPPPTEEECRRQGLVRIELFTGVTCGVDHHNRPCTADELEAWKTAEVSKTTCTKRGDSWSEKEKLCFKRGPPGSTLSIGPPICKR